MDKFIDILRAIRDTLYPDIVAKHTEVMETEIKLGTMSAEITTLLYDAPATVSYDPALAVLHFGIPQGIVGNDGVDGTNGVDGKSAYEIAVINGFVGTQIEWIASLEGAVGAPGATGAPGADGLDGTGTGDMLKTTYDTTNNGKVDLAEAAEVVPWLGVSGKPSTFPPDAHNHTGTYEPADPTILKDADIGVTIQGYDANITAQGNTFNGASQLVKLGADSKLPALDGSLLTGLAGGGATGGGADTVFIETSYNVTQNYTITTGKSAITVGDYLGNVYIPDDIYVIVPDESNWAIEGN